MLMRVEVINYGRAVTVPTCQGDIYIEHLPWPMPMDLQKKAAEEIDAQPEMSVKFPEIIPPPKRKTSAVMDYSGYRINELRSMAAQKKIKGSFTMKKVVLIEQLKKLEETHESAKIR